MKKTSTILLLILFSLVWFSCSKDSQKELPAETFQKATILAEKLQLCLYGRDGQMHGIRSLKKSSTVEILYSDGVLNSKQVENSAFLPVVYENCDYWIDGSKLALNSIPAVIIEKTIPFQDKELKTPLSDRSLKFGTAVAMALSEEYVTEDTQMIYFVDSKDDVLYSAWIKKDDLSSREDDIVVMQVVEDLRVTKRAAPRNELFLKAAKYKPCAKVAAALEAEKVERVTNNYQDVLNALPGAKIKVNIPELLTVDQSKDPFK